MRVHGLKIIANKRKIVAYTVFSSFTKLSFENNKETKRSISYEGILLFFHSIAFVYAYQFLSLCYLCEEKSKSYKTHRIYFYTHYYNSNPLHFCHLIVWFHCFKIGFDVCFHLLLVLKMR